ncbi:hypothetical protein [Cohnella yongneupensis]|uniref:Uncharacterized protein n=1 Tax=Cohnella yongneupensis TaxID=425006 RepID=A0ABW0QYD3_9BACL
MQAEERTWLDSQFAFNERLGIRVPRLMEDWDSLELGRQMAILAQWEHIRGNIPDHVKRFEEQIKIKQSMLYEEEDFAASCVLNSDIAELASRINDLHIWFRTQQDLDRESKRHG